MRGDFSRRTHDPRKHYSAVLHEQGRLLTDADFDEEHRILADAHETAVADLVGAHGGPADPPGAAGFAVSSDGARLILSAGRYHVAGIPVVSETDVRYTEQPDRFEVEWPPAQPGRYAVYLDVWRRTVTALDDPSIREVALGGPTTAARERTVWQARHVAVDDGWTCASELPSPPSTTGRMAARAVPETTSGTPCLVPPLAGYTGLENQFYRVEVLTPGPATDLDAAPLLAVLAFPADTDDQVELAAVDAAALGPGDVVELVATGPGSDPLDVTFAQVVDVDGSMVQLSAALPSFGPTDAPALRRAEAAVVVSRENASVVTTIDRIAGTEVTVGDIGPDSAHGFVEGQWVELTDDAIELEGRPRRLAQIAGVAGTVITLRAPAEPLAPGLDGGVDPDRHPQLRRWDAARAVVQRADGSGWLHLENGIEIRFTDGDYVRGDHWWFPARVAVVDPASGTVEWPQDGGAPAALPPAGVIHRHCPLAVIDVVDGRAGPITTVAGDCRNLFPPATRHRNLLYVGGDGQEARRGDPGFPQLPAPLEVRVTNGSLPVSGARVRFAPSAGAVDTAEPLTDADGIARVTWGPDPDAGAQDCTARLLDSAGDEIAAQVVAFHASIEEATDEGDCCACVGPDGDFPTVEEAVEVLLGRGQQDLCLCLAAGDHVINDLELRADPRERQLTLSIHGCGRGTRVRVQERLEVRGWAALRLCDLDLSLPGFRGMTAEWVGDVQLENVHAAGLGDDGAVVRIGGAERVSVHGCRLDAYNSGTLRRLDELFTDIPVLDGVWSAGVADLPEAVRGAVQQLSGMPVDDRRPIAAMVERLASDRRRRVVDPARSALRRVATQLTDEPLTPSLAAALLAVPSAMRAGPTVALTIGVGEELEFALTDFPRLRPARVTITDNVVDGDVCFYGREGGDPLAPDERKVLGARASDGLLRDGQVGTVHLHDNRLGRVMISAGMLSALHALANENLSPVVYEAFHMSGNVVLDVEGEVVARHVALTGNEFTLDQAPRAVPPVTVLAVVGDSVTVTGNHGRALADDTGAEQPVVVLTAVRARAEAGNLELALS